MGETFNRFADFRYKLHKNSLDGRALPGPAGGAVALPKPRSRSKGREEEGKGWKQGERRGGKGRTWRRREGWEWEESVGKGEGWLNLDICTGFPSFYLRHWTVAKNWPNPTQSNPWMDPTHVHLWYSRSLLQYGWNATLRPTRLLTCTLHRTFHAICWPLPQRYRRPRRRLT